MTFASTYPEHALRHIKVLIVHPNPESTRVVQDADGERSSSPARTVVRHESIKHPLVVVETEEEADGEASESEVVGEGRYQKRRPPNEVSAQVVYAVSADDGHTIVHHVHSVQTLVTVLERYARYRT